MRRQRPHKSLFRLAVASLSAIALLLAFAGTASAESDLDSVLDTHDLTWGMTSKQVLKKIEEHVMNEYEEEAAKVSQHRKKDMLRRKAEKRFERIAKSHKEFKSGKRSGLEVSVVADEFVPDNNESVIVVKDDKATRYYFFVHDKLYKLAIAYDPNYIGNLSFDTFAKHVAKKYGSAKKEKKDADGFFVQAIWEDGSGNRLRVDDKWQTYETYLMAFSDTNLESQVAEKHAAAIDKRYAEPAVSSDIESLTEGEDKSGSAVDAILGGDTQVDLKAGLPEEDLKAMAEDDIVKEKDKKDKAGTSKKKRKKRRRNKRKRDQFKDVDKKEDGGGIIIY